MSNPYSLTFLHEQVRTISLASGVLAPEGNRVVTLSGTYPTAATEVVYGITTNDRNRPGNRIAQTTVAPVATQAYAKNARFTLTAPQAANVGGKAGIYQVTTAFTPVATTLSVAEAPNVFYIGQSLRSNYLVDNASTTPIFDTNQSTYQRDIAVCTLGIAVAEVGGTLLAGASVVSDNQGRVVAATGAAGEYIVGVALDSGQLGNHIRVELRPAK